MKCGLGHSQINNQLWRPRESQGRLCSLPDLGYCRICSETCMPQSAVFVTSFTVRDIIAHVKPKQERTTSGAALRNIPNDATSSAISFDLSGYLGRV